MANAGFWTEAPLSGRLVLADGTVISGQGLGAVGSAVGEVCFNTAITGYQEMVDDPMIDALYIPLPNALHGEWTIRALLAAHDQAAAERLGRKACRFLAPAGAEHLMVAAAIRGRGDAAQPLGARLQ